jgi:hypothetical protein
MMNLLQTTRNTVLALSLLFGTVAKASDLQDDTKTVEEVNKFADESSKMRGDHIQQMRELHLKHVDEMYDRKLTHNNEITLLSKQMKPGDKEANKKIKEQIKEKKKAFHEEEKKFREDFKDNVLKKKNKEFREGRHSRMKEMKGKHRD